MTLEGMSILGIILNLNPQKRHKSHELQTAFRIHRGSALCRRCRQADFLSSLPWSRYFSLLLLPPLLLRRGKTTAQAVFRHHPRHEEVLQVFASAGFGPATGHFESTERLAL